MDSIESLQEKLKQATAAAQPVIVEKLSEDQDQVVYIDHTRGTKRVDLKGGEPVKYEERPAPPVEVPIWSKPFDKAVGKVLKQSESERSIKLVSGTVRQDHK